MSSIFPPKVAVNLGLNSTIYLINSILAGETFPRKCVCMYGFFCQTNIASLEMQIISKLFFSDFLFTKPDFFSFSVNSTKFKYFPLWTAWFIFSFFQASSLANCICQAAYWDEQFRWFMASLCEILSGIDCDTARVIWWSRWLMLLPHWSHGPSLRDFLHVVLTSPSGAADSL